MIEIDEQLRERFNQCASLWRKERGPHSSAYRLCDHPAYHEIEAMGTPAVTMILERFAMGRVDHWFIALTKITGANPVEERHLGRLDDMAADWLAWGRFLGLVN